MYGCFADCEELISVPIITKNVKNIIYCFEECRKLKTVSLKCNYEVTSFSATFKGCIDLTEKGVKVPQTYYDNYTTGEALENMKVYSATIEEKKAKFEGLAEFNL